jgi:hypothetical protein
MTYELLYGSIDTSSGQWNYDSDFVLDNYHWANFPEDLVEGNYTLAVVDSDGDTMPNENSTQYFHGVVELPEVSSKSFRGFEDVDGNLFWQWDPPADIALWSSSLDVSIRCWVSIYDGDDYIGDIYVAVPATLGGMYVPSSVMDLARLKGDNFRIALHTRTNDNDNRFYTNSVALSALKKERPSKTVVIPLL